MRWLLVRFCGLALIFLSVALNEAQLVTQIPRFYGVKTSRNVHIYCMSSINSTKVEWFKTNEDGRIENWITPTHRIKIRTHPFKVLLIEDLHIEDSGVYVCKVNDVWGSGTGLQVSRPVNRIQAQYRSKMKDGLIILQGLLLAVCIAAILHRKQCLFNEKDSIYEEPETDHIYEGLAIETCGGGLYEELSVYTQAEGGEAPWE